MHRGVIRRVPIIVALALVTGLWTVPSATAVVPPGDGGGNSICGTLNAGYLQGYPMNTWDGRQVAKGQWGWDGRLAWDWCVVRTSSGTHYGWARLSSPGPALLSGNYNKVWARLTVELQSCSGWSIVGTKTWNPNYETGNLSGYRYYFSWQQTSSTSNSASSYRVRIEGSGYVIRQDLSGVYFSLGAGPYPPSPASYHVYVSGCVAP